jgi:hypothetical protein
MRHRNLIIPSLVLLLAGSSVVSRATPETVFTLSGKILVTTQMTFTVKLYPPLKSGKRVLLTTSTRAGDFKFSAAASSYLLEVYSGKQLVYQQVIELTANKNITIDLRKSAK